MTAVTNDATNNMMSIISTVLFTLNMNCPQESIYYHGIVRFYIYNVSISGSQDLLRAPVQKLICYLIMASEILGLFFCFIPVHMTHRNKDPRRQIML